MSLLSRLKLRNPLSALPGEPSMLIVPAAVSIVTDPPPNSVSDKVELPLPRKLLPAKVRFPPAPPSSATGVSTVGPLPVPVSSCNVS